MSARRLLILAEGFSGDPHYGKTMRGVLRYRRDDVVAILDSERAGEVDDGVPVVADVDASLGFGPNIALVGVATQGGTLPARLARAPEGLHPAGPRDRERPARVRRRRPGARRAGRRRRGLPHRPAPPAARARRPDRREPRAPGAHRADGRLRLRDREDDRRARARPGGALARPALDLRPDRPDRDRDRRLGDRGRRRRRRLHRGRGGAARRRGERARRRAALGRGSGIDPPPGLLGRHARAHPRHAPHAFVLCHKAGATEVEGYPGHPLMPLPELVELHERISLARRPAVVACVALNTSALGDEAARRPSPRPRRRRGSSSTIPSASARARCSTRCWPACPGSAAARTVGACRATTNDDHRVEICGGSDRVLAAFWFMPAPRRPPTSAPTTTPASSRRTAAPRSSRRWQPSG